MADLNDVQNYEQKFQNQLEKLQESDISEADHEAISKFIRHEDGTGSVNQGTLISHLNRLRLSAERATIPLTKMGADDVDELLFTLKHDHDLSEGTLRNYRKAFRKFFRWRDTDWADNIEIGASPDRNVDPSKLLTENEIDDLLETADHIRDKAALALLADTGLRIGALASLRIRDIDTSGRIATVSINENANVKGASGSVPLTWSRGYVANWLDMHPRSDDENVPLIYKLRLVGEDEDGALTYQYLSRRIRAIGEEAGIDSDRLHPHNFRKSAISRWIREGLDEQKIKHRAHWVKDSGQFEVYSGVTDEEMNEEIAANYGIVDEEGTTRPGLDACPQCSTPLRDSMRFCPGCGAPLTDTAAETFEEVDDDTIKTIANADGRKIEKALEFRKAFKNDPEFRRALLED